jgi:hypothetical protein
MEIILLNNRAQPGKMQPSTIQRKATGPYAPNIGPKMGLLPQYLNLNQGVSLLSMEQNYPVCVGVGRSGSIDIGFKYTQQIYQNIYPNTNKMTAV